MICCFSLLDNPALVFKTIADVIKRESSSPNSDEECEFKTNTPFYQSSWIGIIMRWIHSEICRCHLMFGYKTSPELFYSYCLWNCLAMNQPTCQSNIITVRHFVVYQFASTVLFQLRNSELHINFHHEQIINMASHWQLLYF